MIEEVLAIIVAESVMSAGVAPAVSLDNLRRFVRWVRKAWRNLRRPYPTEREYAGDELARILLDCRRGTHRK